MTSPTELPNASLGPAPTPPSLVWAWSRALTGAVYALPAAVAALSDPSAGVPLAVGVLPAALLPVPPRRRSRAIIAVVGVLAGASLFLGGVLAHLPELLGAVALLLVVVAAALLTTRLPAGRLVLYLCAPLMAAGLSYDDYATSAETFALLSAGACYAWLVSLAWPSREAPARPDPVRPSPPALPSRPVMLRYGVRLGTAAALAYLAAAELELDHAGWAAAACLLVSRPQLDLLRSRGVGRVLAVVVGALLAAVTLAVQPSNAVYSALVVLVLAAVAATAGSRWYITSAFTTYFVFIMLLYDDPAQTAQTFDERVGETVLGVALAYLFNGAMPLVSSHLKGRHRIDAP